jgi:hypothetical protein
MEGLLYTLRNQRFRSRRVPVIDTKLKASLQEIARHGEAHISYSDETNRFAHHSVSFNCRLINRQVLRPTCPPERPSLYRSSRRPGFDA